MQLVMRSHRGLRRLQWNQDYADVALAIVVTLVALYGAVRANVHLDGVSIPLLLIQILPIAVRRRNPMRVLLATGLAITLYSLLGYPGTGAQFGVFVAFYTVAANEPRRRTILAAALTAAGIFVSFAAFATYEKTGWTTDLTSTYLSFGLAWLIGDNLRVRRAYTMQLEDKAAALERDREEQAVQAVTEERTRIARELHDVVAHYVSVMVVQAAGARRVVDKDPEAAKGALEAVEGAGRTALAEMRRMLEVLRADDSGMGPQPGLGEVDRLIQHVRDAGLPVELKIEGEACCLPAGMDLAAYRIVQEALTNTVKHGGKATARVLVRYQLDTLEIEVVDDGRGAAAPLLSGAGIGGHGLVGMQERVGLFGGVLEAGPLITGGYRVYARMPLEPDDVARLKSERDRALARMGEQTPKDDRSEQPARHTTRSEPLVKQLHMPPVMIRVVPPHRTEQGRPRGRTETEGKQ